MATVSCGRTSGQYIFIEKLRLDMNVVVLLRLLGVSKSGYYDLRKRQPSAREIKDRKLKIKIQEIYNAHKGRYESPRIFKAYKS